MINTKILKNLLKELAIIFLYIFLSIGLSLLFGEKILTSNICNLLVTLIILVIFFVIFRKTFLNNIKDFRENGLKYLNQTFPYYIVGLIIMIVSNLIISHFIGIAENEEAVLTILDNLPIYSILNMVLFAPIIEESMTRIILKDTFKNSYVYIILSGLIFGLLHVVFNLQNNWLELLYIIPYSSLGITFAKMYNDTNNIWTNIFYHSLHNLICVLLLFIP